MATSFQSLIRPSESSRGRNGCKPGRMHTHQTSRRRRSQEFFWFFFGGGGGGSQGHIPGVSNALVPDMNGSVYMYMKAKVGSTGPHVFVLNEEQVNDFYRRQFQRAPSRHQEQRDTLTLSTIIIGDISGDRSVQSRSAWFH